MIVEPQGALTCRSSTLTVFVDVDPFHGLLLCFGVPKRFPLLSKPGVRLLASHHHSQFWPILFRFLDYYSPFSGPELISTTNEPRGAFTCRSSTLAVFVYSDPFHGLLLNIGVPKRFPWLSNTGVPTLVVLVDYCPFRGLLLTILGSQSDFHGYRTPRCAYVSVISTRGFSRL